MSNKQLKDEAKGLIISHTEASDGWGGQEIRILTESKWLRSRGHLVLLGCSRGSILGKKAANEGFSVENFNFKKRTVILDIIKICAWLRKTKPKVLATHSSEDSWAGLIAGRICRVPLLIRYRHVSVEIKPNFANRFLYNYLCDGVITTAECIRRELIFKLGLKDGKIRTIPTGINPPEFRTNRENARIELAKRLGLNEGARFISCIAVLRGWKGHELLMRAFKEISAKIKNYHLLIAGDGPAKIGLNMLREQLGLIDRIHFLGHVDDPYPIFRGSDLAVLASIKNEGVPQSLVQAMFAGCPTLGTNTGGIPEVVIPGKTGWLVESGSVNALAEGIYNAIIEKGKSEQMATNAMRFVQSNFTIDHMGESVENMIFDFLNSKLKKIKTSQIRN